MSMHMHMMSGLIMPMFNLDLCIEFYGDTDGVWNDHSCAEEMPFVCKTRKSLSYALLYLLVSSIRNPIAS